MIEVTRTYADGASFVTGVRLKDTGERIGGVRVHYVDKIFLTDCPHVEFFLKSLGLRRIGEEDWSRRAYPYAESIQSYLYLKTFYFLTNLYFKFMKFLYLNATLFRRIPVGEQFSWRYCTLFIWYNNIKKLFLNKKG